VETLKPEKTMDTVMVDGKFLANWGKRKYPLRELELGEV
jgi:hypothetical protein